MARRALIASSQIWDGSSMPVRPNSKTFLATILAMGSPRVDHPDYNAPADLQCQFTVEFTNLLRLGNEAFVSLLREFGLKFKGLVERPHASELLEKGHGLIERLRGVVAISVRDGSIADRDGFRRRNRDDWEATSWRIRSRRGKCADRFGSILQLIRLRVLLLNGFPPPRLGLLALLLRLPFTLA